MSFPVPTRAAHQRFCDIEGWVLVRTAEGHVVGHNITYELAVPDGRILRTRVSRPPGKQSYGLGLWRHILRDQLQVEEAVFWACVKSRVVPDRGVRKPRSEGLPPDLVHLLRSRLHLPEAEIAGMTRHDAVARLAAYWSASGESSPGSAPARAEEPSTPPVGTRRRGSMVARLAVSRDHRNERS